MAVHLRPPHGPMPVSPGSRALGLVCGQPTRQRRYDSAVPDRDRCGAIQGFGRRHLRGSRCNVWTAHTHTDTGIRAFGGHSARVSGAQLFAALNIEVNKIRLMARHSGEVIMRYVQDAPLRSLRADMGLISPDAHTALVTRGLIKTSKVCRTKSLPTFSHRRGWGQCG